MAKVVREPRYAVFKITDMQKYLTPGEISILFDIGAKIAAGRSKDLRQPFNAVVVEQDWPEFEMVWASIERRTTVTEGDPRYAPVCCRCYSSAGPLLPANCSERPELLLGAPLGQYHCPDCGAMVVAGVPHGDMCQQCLDRNHPGIDGPPTV